VSEPTPVQRWRKWHAAWRGELRTTGRGYVQPMLRAYDLELLDQVLATAEAVHRVEYDNKDLRDRLTVALRGQR